MNKRIEELIVQAGDYVNETYTGPVPTTFTGNPGWHKEFDKWAQFSEKFAELIVKECLNIAKNWEDQLENAGCLKESNAVGIVAYRISRQFGVEE